MRDLDDRQVWREAAAKSLITGTAASLTSTAMLTLCGWIERRTPAGPSNGPSQWVWGEAEGYRSRLSWRHTGVGYLIHHASALMWGFVHEIFFRRTAKRARPLTIIGEGIGTAALAGFVDYALTPRRLQPGFEKHLSVKSIVAVYAAFGFGLALPRLLARRRS